MEGKKKFYIQLVIVVLVLILSTRKLFNNFYFPIHDDVQIVRIQQMVKVLSDGIFPVRWVPDLGYGYGYPLFNFYAPLPYYIGSLFYLLGFSLLSSVKIMMGFGMIFAGISMFLLARKLFGFWGGVLSAVLYQYAPYHAVELFVRGSIGELYAYAMIPLVFLGILMILIDKKVHRGITISSLGLSMVFLSHNVTTLMLTYQLIILSILLIVFLFFTKENKKRKKLLIRAKYVFLSFLLALGISSFFLIPAFWEKGYTMVDKVTKGKSDYHMHFVYLDQLWDSPWGFAGSAEGRADGMSFKIGKLHLFFAILGIGGFFFYLKEKKKDYKYLLYNYLYILLVVLLIFSLGMTNEIAIGIWDILPYSVFIQFPWRFLIFVVFSLSVLAGGISFIFKDKIGKLIIFLGIILVIVVNAKYFNPQKLYVWSEHQLLKDDYILWEKSKISDEYLPIGFPIPKTKSEIASDPITFFSGEITNVKKSSNKMKASLFSENGGVAVINIAYFPGWKVIIDGKEEKQIVKNGKINVWIPKGTHSIEAYFANTPVRIVGNLISLISILILFGTIESNYIWRRIKR